MAKEQALALIKRLATDGEFRNQLNALDIPGKQALLAQSGFGGVLPDHVRSAAAAAFNSLTDKENARTAGH